MKAKEMLDAALEKTREARRSAAAAVAEAGMQIDDCDHDDYKELEALNELRDLKSAGEELGRALAAAHRAAKKKIFK